MDFLLSFYRIVNKNYVMTIFSILLLSLFCSGIIIMISIILYPTQEILDLEKKNTVLANQILNFENKLELIDEEIKTFQSYENRLIALKEKYGYQTKSERGISQVSFAAFIE